MSITPFKLGRISMIDDPDAGQALLEGWLKVIVPQYLASPEYEKLSKANKKATGEWFELFMELSLHYIGEDLKDLDEQDAREIMLDLFPRKLICSDTQAKTIVPDILACWQFLDRELNSGKRRKLKYAEEVIQFLQSIKSQYLKIYKREDEQVHPVGPLYGLDPETLLDNRLSPKNDDGYDWVIQLIEETARSLNSLRHHSGPPENWLILTNPFHFAQFLHHICIYGFDESQPDAVNAVGELLHFSCNNLFMLVRQGDTGAKSLWQETEENIQGAYESGELQPIAVKLLCAALVEFKQFMSQDFLAFIQKWHMAHAGTASPEESTPQALQQHFLAMINEVPDEFVALSLLKECIGFIPAEAFQMLTALLMETGDKAVDTLALMVLDDNEDNATAIAEVLATRPDVMTPKTLSRLIRIRNWLSPAIQKPVDQLIRNARKKGITPGAPAPIADKDIVETYVSGVDGSGAQGVMLLVRDSQAFRLIAFVLKEAVGVVDVMVSPPGERFDLIPYTAQAKANLRNVEEVSVDLIRQQLPFFVALNLTSKVAIDHEFVQVMELLGLESWNPQSADLSTLYENLLENPPSSAEIEVAQKRSGNWPKGALGDSWFEHPDKVNPLRPLNKKNLNRLFDEVLESSRHQWGERMGRMALWCQAATSKRRQNQSKDFAVVSWLLRHSDLAVKDIKFTSSIAKKCI